MYIEKYKEELMEYIKSSLEKVPNMHFLPAFDQIIITGEYHAEYEHGVLFDMFDRQGTEEQIVMSGCVWYDYGTIYIVRKTTRYSEYNDGCIYYGHPDTCVGFEEFMKTLLPEVPDGILKLPERVA